MKTEIYEFCKRYLMYCQKDKNEFTLSRLGINLNFRSKYYKNNSDILPFLSELYSSYPEVVELFVKLDEKNILHPYINLIMYIYKCRKKQNITLKELATMSNLSKLNVFRIENFIIIPKTDNLLSLLFALNLNNITI